ncbi:hypothetical protein [Pseudorhodoplanes sp.]|uniref:hypothetical protein n=1 Tax=Pseudorhodoplanes sp. TaxID=1934341 RepID=UPI003D0D7F77
MSRLAAFSAAAPRPFAVLEAIGALAQRVIGAKAFTMFRYLHEAQEVERIHSSDPVFYPVGGRKRVSDFPTNQSVLGRGEVYVAEGPDDIRATYKDYEKILKMGVTSIMNVPVRLCAANIGAVNLLGQAGQFDEAAAGDARVLAALMAPIVLQINGSLR